MSTSSSNSDKASGVVQETIKQFLSPVNAYLEDPTVSEILINGYQEIFVERKGKLERVDARFADDDSLMAAINNIARSVERRIDRENPRLDARLPGGSRIAAVFPPCSRKGPIMSIRKFTNNKITFQDYIRFGAITPDAAMFLEISMFLGKNILVSGGTGSGKTTLLGLLCSRIPKGQRIIVIEDSSELEINYEHMVNFEKKEADAQGKGEVTIQDLLKSSLRLRPDRIIVGEVRGAEALELINAMNTGHKGCLGTIHANSPADAIVRLEALAQGGENKISEKALRYQVGSAIELIIQVSRYSDGSRKIAQIAEVRGFLPDGNYDVVPLFDMSRMVRSPDGKLSGALLATGEKPTFMNEIIDNKLAFPESKFSKAS